MDAVSIANMATASANFSLQSQVSVAMLDKAMESTTESASQLIESFDASMAAVGDVGRNIDVYA